MVEHNVLFMAQEARKAARQLAAVSLEKRNAALLAIEILAVTDDALAAKLDEKRRNDAEKVLQKDAALQ